MLGRDGTNRPRLRLADFRDQQGIYILYGNHGPSYVGLTKKQGLGKRLKDHLTDGLSPHWDRFSWFGFCRVLKGTDNGLHKLGAMAEIAVGSPESVITDVEALLIRAMGLRNIAQSNFEVAEEWAHVELDEVEYYMKKVREAKLT